MVIRKNSFYEKTTGDLNVIQKTGHVTGTGFIFAWLARLYEALPRVKYKRFTVGKPMV